MTLRIPPGGIKCSTGNNDTYIRFGVGHFLTLSLSVRRHFPGCIGLQYLLSDGSYDVLRVEGGKVYPPIDGWGPEDRIYTMIFAKGRPPWTVKQMIERKFRVDGTSLDMITEDGLISIPQVQVGDSVTPVSCSICLEEFENQASACMLPCSHIFHKQCLSEWIVINQSCPFCRFDLLSALQLVE